MWRMPRWFDTLDVTELIHHDQEANVFAVVLKQYTIMHPLYRGVDVFKESPKTKPKPVRVGLLTQCHSHTAFEGEDSSLSAASRTRLTPPGGVFSS